MGVDCYNKKKYAEAMPYLQQSASQGNVRAFYYIALCHQRQGNKDMATQMYEHIRQTWPRSVEARYAVQYLNKVPDNPYKGPPPGAETAPEKPKVAPTDLNGNVLPMEARIPYQKRAGHMWVRAKVNGKWIDIIFDTGAAYSTISITDFPDVFSQEEYIKGEEVEVMRPHGLNTQKMVEGEISVDRITRRCKIFLSLETGVSLIGGNFFKEYSYEVDDFYIRLSRAPQKTPVASSGNDGKIQKDKYSVPYQDYSNCMMVEMSLNGQKIDVLFDTGCAPDGLVMPTHMVKELKIHQRSDGYYSADSVVLGPIAKRDTKVYPVDGGSLILIGPHFFGDRRYTVDRVNKVIRFQY